MRSMYVLLPISLMMLSGLPQFMLGNDAKPATVPKSLQGKWVLISTEESGQAKRYDDRSIVFDNGEYRFYVKTLLVRKAEVAVDEAATPPTLDLRQTFGPNKGKLMKCIFRVEDDKLTIADGMYDERRPATYDSSTPECFSVTVWKRQKE